MSSLSASLVALMLVAMIVVIPAAAVPTGETSKTTVGTPSTYDPTAGSAAARGGNITDVTFASVLTDTSRWQGYYGNVTGDIILGTSTSNIMFKWTVSTIAGEVFATQDSDVSITEWEGLQARTGANIDTDFGFTAGSDRAVNTFNDDPSAIVVAGKSIDGGENTAAKTYNSTDVETWYTIALASTDPVPADGNYVFAGVISNDGEAYDGTAKDFQMVVPENEATGTDTYYFYVELT